MTMTTAPWPKENQALARQARPGWHVPARQAVNRRQVVGIESMLQAQAEHQQAESNQIVGKGIGHAHQ
jgi:hypothetical protein